MRHALVFIAANIALALGMGCSKDSPTQPKPKPLEQPLASATIGPEGGTLTTSDLSLSVPAGAFAESTLVELYAAEDDQQADSSVMSDLFRLRGLPSDFAVPLRVKIKYTGVLEGFSAVGVGKKFYDMWQPDSVIEYQFHEATDSAGYLVAELTAPPFSVSGAPRITRVSAADDDERWDAYLRAYSKYSRNLSAHFYAYIVKPFWDIPLLEHLEDTYSKFVKMGFKYPPDDNPFIADGYISVSMWPPDRLDHDDPGEGVDRMIPGRHIPNLRFNPDWVWGYGPEAPEIGPYVSRVFCEMTAQLYDQDRDSLTHWWLLEATSLWSEGLFPTYPNYVPSQFKGHEMEPFKGLMAIGPDAASSRSHGLGMAALIKYFSDRWETADDSAALSLMYQRISAKSFTVPQAVTMIDQDRETGEWYPDFYKEYLSGNVYNVPADTFLTHLTGTYTVRSAGDSLARFTSPYADLSAKMYGVNLFASGLDLTSNITLTASSSTVGSDDLRLVVFKSKAGELEYLGSGVQVVVPAALSLANQGWNILAVVVNSRYQADYQGSSSIMFEVTVSKGELFSAMTQSTIHFGNINYTMRWGAPDTCDGAPPGGGRIFFYNGAQGTVTDRVFTGTFADTLDDDYWGHYIRHWTVVITANADLSAASFVISDTTWTFDDNGIIYQKFAASDIPVQGGGTWGFDFYFEGDLCTKLTWQYWFDDFDYCDQHLDTYDCTVPSAVYIELN